jgi:hypothetical protein
VRWAQQAAVIGNITISSTTGGTCLIDGTTVWWIKYDGGVSTIPAAGSTLTGDTSGATGEVIGWFTGYGVAASASGGATSAAGYIKLRSKTGTFQDNENLSVSSVVKAVVNSSTGGKKGWIHIVGEEATTITVPRLGTLSMTGDWFELDDTISGARAQTIQLPVADQYPGVWIETSSGSGVYEFWPNCGVQIGTTNYPVTTTDDRSKVVHITASGVLYIGSTSGGTSCANLPATGAKVRIPNIIIGSAATAAFAVNSLSATLATRWDLTTTTSGAISIDKVICSGFYINAGQAYSLSLTNCAFLEQLAFSEIASPVVLTECHVGLPATNIAAVGSPLVISTCFAGGTITDCIFMRPTMASASQVIGSFTDMDGFDFDNVRCISAAVKASTTPVAFNFLRVSNFTLTDCIAGDGRFLITTSRDMTLTNTKYYDRLGTTTTSVGPVSAFDITAFCSNITVSGFANYDSLANVHPYTAIVNIGLNCSGIKVRNIGTAASPYDCGSANATGVLVQENGLCSDISVQRVYCQNTRTSLFGTQVNSTTRFLAECVWGDGADSQAISVLNGQFKGCRLTNSVTGQTAVYGTHFCDAWTSTTAGRLVIHMNEKTSVEPSASAYSVIAGTPKFTSAGQLIMATANDEIVFTLPYYMQGVTSFLPATATQPTFTGTNPNNHDIYYKIDKNDGSGYNASWRNLAYKRTGAGGSAASSNVTMTSTTGVAVGDYVFGTGIGTNARVSSITNATTVVVNVVNSGAVSGVLVFNQLPFESGLVAADGVKLQVRIVTGTTSATNAITYLRIDTVTTSSDQNAVAYPLDTVTITLTGLETDSEVRVYSDSAGVNDVELAGTDSSGTSFAFDVEGSTTINIMINHLNFLPADIWGLNSGTTDATIPVSQFTDRQYLNP